MKEEYQESSCSFIITGISDKRLHSSDRVTLQWHAPTFAAQRRAWFQQDFVALVSNVVVCRARWVHATDGIKCGNRTEGFEAEDCRGGPGLPPAGW